jgi:hypothetical protein
MSISKSTILKHLSKIESDTINHEWISMKDEIHTQNLEIYFIIHLAHLDAEKLCGFIKLTI